MKQNKLIKLFKVLSPEEFRRFKKFVKSPYFNANPKLVALYDYLQKYYPAFDHLKLSQQSVFKKIFPGQPFNGKKLGNLFSVTTGLVEEYLVILKLKKDEELKQRLLTEVYGDRDLPEYFEKSTLKLIEALEALPYQNIDQLNHLLQLNKRLLFHPVLGKLEYSSKVLEQLMDHLDYYYFLFKLRLAGEMKNREKQFSEDYTIKLLEEVKSESRLNYLGKNPLFDIYLNVLELHRSGEEHTFLHLKHSYIQNTKFIPKEEQRPFLLQLHNYSIGAEKSGKEQCWEHMFDLYKAEVEDHTLMKEHKMVDSTFLNIVVTGSRMKAFKWTENFLENHNGHLNKKNRFNMLSLCKGYFHFHKKEFDTTLSSLMNCHFDDTGYLVQKKSLLLRTYFEQFLKNPNNYEFLLAYIQSFEKYIRRNMEISNAEKDAYLNFILFTKKLAKYSIDPIQTDQLSGKLLGQLDQKKVIIARKWLREKSAFLS